MGRTQPIITYTLIKFSTVIRTTRTFTATTVTNRRTIVSMDTSTTDTGCKNTYCLGSRASPVGVLTTSRCRTNTARTMHRSLTRMTRVMRDTVQRAMLTNRWNTATHMENTRLQV